jgi:polysaccharide pyruvyl transferase WcaK-like protein
MTPAVTVLGSAGGGNLGDVAVLRAVVAEVRRIRPDARIRVPAPDPALAARLWPGVEGVPTGRFRFFTPPVLRAASGSSAVLTTAGIFFDQQLWNFRISFVSSIAPLARVLRARRVPVVGFNVGIAPPTRRLGRALYRAALGAHEAVWLRDPADRRVLEALGLAGGARDGADTAFLLPEPDPAPLEAWLGERGLAGRPLVGVNLNRFGGRFQPGAGPVDPDALADAALAGAAAAARRAGAALLLVPTAGKDEPYLAAAAGRLGAAAGAAALLPARDLDLTRAALGRCRAALGMRMHSLVFAAAAGVPVAGIEYHPKVRGLLDRLGLAAGSIPLAAVTRERVEQAVGTLLDRCDAARAALAPRVAALREAARGASGTLAGLLA